jgi:hypothetical protein
MTVRERVNPKAGCMGIVLSVGVLLFCSAMITILLAVAIWPGEAKLTAPFLCSEDQPDPFVVVDTYSNEPGETSYNFTLYCVGERGDFTDAGFGGPFFILWGLHTVFLLGLIALFVVYRAIRRRGRDDDTITPTGPQPSPLPTPPADPIVE